MMTVNGCGVNLKEAIDYGKKIIEVIKKIDIGTASGDALTEDEIVSNMGETIYNGFKDRKEDEIIEIMSENEKKRNGLKKSLTEAFNSVEGNIIDRGDIIGQIADKETDNGDVTFCDGIGIINGIKTDKGNKYVIRYMVNLVDNGNNTNEVYLILLYDDNQHGNPKLIAQIGHQDQDE